MPRSAVSTSSRSRTARVLLAALALLVVSVTGCATGFGAQTTTVFRAPEGADVRTGDVKGLNMLVVAYGAGAGTLVTALVNTAADDDQLLAATATSLDGDPVTVTGLDAPVTLPPQTLVQLAGADIDPIGLSGDPVRAGTVLRLELQFANAGAVRAEVPVVDRVDEYTSVPTPPVASTAAPGAGSGGGGNG